jgi:hypothetical protein
MTTEKRSRGRPVGSGKKDGGYLARVADELLANPKLKPTTAIKHVIYNRADQTERDDTLVRRLQGKWRTSKAEHFDAAQKRLDSRQFEGVSVRQLVNTLRDPEVQRSIREAGMRIRLFAENIANSPAAKALAQFANSPMGKALANYADSPAAKRMAQLHNSPAYENMRRNLERIQNPYPITLPPKR